jgi:hypothetical protein
MIGSDEEEEVDLVSERKSRELPSQREVKTLTAILTARSKVDYWQSSFSILLFIVWEIFAILSSSFVYWTLISLRLLVGSHLS